MAGSAQKDISPGLNQVAGRFRLCVFVTTQANVFLKVLDVSCGGFGSRKSSARGEPDSGPAARFLLFCSGGQSCLGLLPAECAGV